MVADHNLQGVACLVYADQSVLKGLKASGRRHMASVVAAIDVQKRVVTLLDVLHQLEHLLRVLRRRSRLVEFLKQAGPVLDKVVDVFLVNVAKLLGAMAAPIKTKPQHNIIRRDSAAGEQDFRYMIPTMLNLVAILTHVLSPKFYSTPTTLETAVGWPTTISSRSCSRQPRKGRLRDIFLSQTQTHNGMPFVLSPQPPRPARTTTMNRNTNLTITAKSL